MLTDQQYLRFVDEISSISEHPIKHRLDVGDSSCHGAVVCPTGARVGEASILAFSGVLKHTDWPSLSSAHVISTYFNNRKDWNTHSRFQDYIYLGSELDFKVYVS